MLKAIIDATCYPVIRVEAKERPAVPTHALQVLEFDPLLDRGFLLYFKETENEEVI